jgi:hypothetical protein
MDLTRAKTRHIVYGVGVQLDEDPVNSLFQTGKRKARGYRSEKIIIAMLYVLAGKLNFAPCYGILLDGNSLIQNKLIVAHVPMR